MYYEQGILEIGKKYTAQVASVILAYATSQTQCLQGTESSFSLGDCARVAEHPVDVRLATTEAERRPNTPPLGADMLKRS